MSKDTSVAEELLADVVAMVENRISQLKGMNAIHVAKIAELQKDILRNHRLQRTLKIVSTSLQSDLSKMKS